MGAPASDLLLNVNQDEVDDLIGDEADEVADQAEVQKAYRQVHQDQDQDINPEQLEQYIKDRFESRQEYAGGDFNEQAGKYKQV